MTETKNGVTKGGVNGAISATERQRRALEFRKGGATYDLIARELGYATPSGAAKAVKTALRRTIQEPADEVRQLEIARLDKMLAAHWPAVLKGNVPSTLVALRIQERRAKLLGLDAPAKINVDVIVATTAEQFGLNDDETAELHDRVQEFLDAAKAGEA